MAVVVKLSILMPALACRESLRLRLMEVLQPQIDQFRDQVELLVDLDDGSHCIGRKRNELLARACGQYVCHIDDDDLVAPNYVQSVLDAIDRQPDCVGFKVQRFSDDRDIGYSVNSLAAGFYHKEKLPDGRALYWRTPNHLNPIRRDLALRCKFPEMNFGEDTAFAKQLRPHLRTEWFIDEYLYLYYYRTPMTRMHETVNDGRS